MRKLSWLFLCALLAGCQTGGTGADAVTADAPAGTPAAAGANPITGEAIATTSLDGGAGAAKPAAALELPAAQAVDASIQTGTAALPVRVEKRTQADPEAEAAAEAAAGEAETGEATEAPAEEALPEEPEELKSEAQLRCEQRGGTFASAPNGMRGCVRTTRDSGKRCDADSDCQGQCLARSRTCAPFDPLLGCNEVLQDNGQAATLCLN